jgi:hypothetical protein
MERKGERKEKGRKGEKRIRKVPSKGVQGSQFHGRSVLLLLFPSPNLQSLVSLRIVSKEEKIEIRGGGERRGGLNNKYIESTSAIRREIGCNESSPSFLSCWLLHYL